MRLRGWLVPLATWLFLVLSTGAHAFDLAPEGVRALKEKVPSLAAFSSDGLVWRLERRYRMLSDGSTEASCTLVAQIGERIPGALRRLFVPVPDGGSAQAGLRYYDPMTWREVGSVSPKETQLEGVRGLEMSLPQDAAGRVVLITLVQRVPSRASLSGFVSFGMELPVWEEVLSVEIPSGRGLNFKQQGVQEPVVGSLSGVEAYVWINRNQPPMSDSGLVDRQRPWVSFSTSRGPEAAFLRLREMDSVRTDRLSGLPKDPKGKLEALESRWSSSLKGVRVMSLVGGSDPVGSRLTLALRDALEAEGHHVETWWAPKSGFAPGDPVSDGMWLTPVLRSQRLFGGSPFYVGQGVPPGEVPMGLLGRTLYRSLPSGEIGSMGVPMPPAENSRVSSYIRGSVSPDGRFEGTMEVLISGAWIGLVDLEDPLGWLNTGGSFIFDGVRVRRSQRGLVLESPMAGQLDVGANGMLLKIPSVYPRMLEDLVSRGEVLKPRFPFLLEQRVDLGVPKGTSPVVEPVLKNSRWLRQRISSSSVRGRISFSAALTVRDAAGGRSDVSSEDFFFFIRGLGDGILVR